MGKADEYRNRLKSLADWKPFLLAESGLPGKRANLELLEIMRENLKKTTVRPSGRQMGPKGAAALGGVNSTLPVPFADLWATLSQSLERPTAIL